MSVYWTERKTLRDKTAELYMRVHNQQMTVDGAVQTQMLMMDALAPSATTQVLGAAYPVYGAGGVEVAGQWSMASMVKETLSYPFRLAGKTLKFMFNAAVLVLVMMATCAIVFLFLKFLWFLVSPFVPSVWRPVANYLFGHL